MRKNYFLTLLLTLCLASYSFGQTTVFQESFETGNSGTPSETCNDGFDFFTRAINDGSELGSSYIVTGQDGDYIFAAMDTDGSPCSMSTQTLTFDDIDISTYTNLTFAILIAEDKDGSNFDWDGNTNFYVEVDVDNSGSFTKLIQVSANANSGSNVSQPMIDSDFDGVGDGPEITDVFTEYTASLSSGSLVDIRIVFENLDAGDEDIAIDNIRIVDGFVSEPSLSITAPSNNAEFHPWTTETPINFDVQNFTLSGDNGSGMSDGSGDGYIVGTSIENGGTPEIINIFSLTQTYENLSPGDMVTLTAELVDNAGNPLSPPVTSMATFTVATATQVNDIAALRAGTEGDYYELTGEAVMTVDAMNSRNQKYIQDGSAAILIDDDNGIITTSYSAGDGITGIKGQLSSYFGVLQFVPQVDPGAASSMGNTVTPQVVTIADLTSSLDTYESELVTINDVTFVEGDGTATFSSGNGNHDITDGTNTMIFRLNFSTDINGTVIPTSSANITGIAAEFDGDSQIFGLSLSDIVLSVERNEILGYEAYPNPVRGNNLTITTGSIDNKQVDLFNVLGRKVFSDSFSGTQKTINISNVASGIYILKVTEGNKVATQKLIIE